MVNLDSLLHLFIFPSKQIRHHSIASRRIPTPFKIDPVSPKSTTNCASPGAMSDVTDFTDSSRNLTQWLEDVKPYNSFISYEKGSEILSSASDITALWLNVNSGRCLEIFFARRCHIHDRLSSPPCPIYLDKLEHHIVIGFAIPYPRLLDPKEEGG